MKHVLTVILCFAASISFGQEKLEYSIRAKAAVGAEFSPDGKNLIVIKGKIMGLYNTGSDTKLLDIGSNGHSKEVTHVHFSENNSLLASSGQDKTIHVWDAKTGMLKHTLDGHQKGVYAIKFIQNDRIVSASDDNTLKIWDLKTGTATMTFSDHSKPIRGLAVSPDGKLIASGGGDSKIIIRDASTGEITNQFVAHDDWVRSLDFSPNGQALASGGDDKVVKIWDVETGELKRSFNAQKGWIHDLEFSSDGKFLASASDDKDVVIYELESGSIAMKLVDFKAPVLDIDFNPNGKEIVSVEEYSSDVKVWDVSALGISAVYRFKDESDKASPQIFVSNPPNIQNNRVRFSRDLLDITGTVIDESGVRQLRINGIETPIRDNGNFIIKLPLSMGDNFVTIEAIDVNDNIALKKFIVNRRDLDGEDYDPGKARNYLFIVGINDYQYWPKLFNAVRDANDVASTLIGMYDFDFSDVTVLLDEQATRNNIYKTLRSYIERVTPNDNMMVYFSGHGHFDELLNEGYWIPYEAHLNADGEYLPNSSILKILENINSQHTFLVADACFSGSLFGEQQRGYADNVEKFKSRWGLASGRLETVSDGAYGQNSPFADSFLEYLRTNTKEKFTVSELVQHVKIKVADNADQTPLGNPLKSLGDEGGEFVFYKRK